MGDNSVLHRSDYEWEMNYIPKIMRLPYADSIVKADTGFLSLWLFRIAKEMKNKPPEDNIH